MRWAARTIASPVCLQGNLDPVALLGGTAPMLDEARAILEAARSRAHVFNLGHGVLPQTDPEAVGRLVAHLQSGHG